jgi:hypothetical protein
VKHKQIQVRLVVGEDVKLEQIVEYIGKTVTSKFYEKKIFEITLNGWLQRVWCLFWVMLRGSIQWHVDG